MKRAILVPIIVVCCLYSAMAPAQTRNVLDEPILSSDEQRRLGHVEVESLIVVHAATFYDLQSTARSAIDELISKFRTEYRKPVFFLMNKMSRDSWYTSNPPDYLIPSENGEHYLDLSATNLTVVGGFWNQCMSTTVSRSVFQHFSISYKPITIHVPLEGAYGSVSNGNSLIQAYLKNKKDFILNVAPQFVGFSGKDLQVNVFIDNELAYSEGTGTQIVRLQLWTSLDKYYARYSESSSKF